MLTGLLLPVVAVLGVPPSPHLIFVMADDLGSHDVGWNDPTALTPEIDGLAKGGVVLEASYTWSWCAPSRGAFLTGRYAPKSGFEGSGGPTKSGAGSIAVMPTGYEMLPAMLKRLGNYQTVMAGKWHLGFARTADLPEERGFDAFLGYLSGGEDYYTHAASGGPGCKQATDLWFGTPGGHGRPPAAATADYNGTYSTELYASFLAKRIAGHDPAVPLFVYAAFQGVHYPLQVPRRFFERYAAQGAGQGRCAWELQKNTSAGYANGFACDHNAAFPADEGPIGLDCLCNRLLVKAQVSSLSEAVGTLVDALKANGDMWNNSVLVFQGDNGGPLDGAHSNFPLRGGKLNFFEGGIRPAAFVHSPLLPAAAHGTAYGGMLHEVDWYATFARLATAGAGALSSARAGGGGGKEEEGVPLLQAGLDGMDAWDTLCNGSVAHRGEVLLADHILRVGQWKLVAGGARGDTAMNWRISMLKGCMLGTGGGWLAPPTNATCGCPKDIYTGGSKDSIACPDDVAKNKSRFAVVDDVDLWLCSTPCTMAAPCLWDVVADPQERHEVAAANPDVVARLRTRLQELQKDFQNASTIKDNGNFCAAAKARAVSGIGPVIGPWINQSVETRNGVSASAAPLSPLSFGAPVDLGAGQFSAWSLASIYSPPTTQYELIISVGQSVLRSGDGKSWGASGTNKTFGVLTAYPPPAAAAANFPLHGFGTTEAAYQGEKVPFGSFAGVDPVYYSIDASGALRAVTMTPSSEPRGHFNLSFTGLPRDIGCIQTTCCNCPFRASSGNTVRLADNSLVLAMNVFYKPTPGLRGDGSSVVLFYNKGDGLDWAFRSNIAVAEDFRWSGEGPNESTISLMADGKTLICIFRVDAGDGGTGGKPYAKTFSDDSGKTWSAPTNMSASIGTAKPRLILMDATKGPLILVGGRPGNKVWVNPDGFGGDEWFEQDMPPPPSLVGSPPAGVGRTTTSYNGIAKLTSTTGAVSFDYYGRTYAAYFELNGTVFA